VSRLRSRTHFRRYRGRRVPFLSFARPDSFSAVLRASGPVLMFCAPGLLFGRNEGVGYRFQVLRSRSRFSRYRGRRVPFALPDSFSALPRASGPIFKFCAPGLIFGGTEGVRSRFYVLRSLTCFVRCRVRRVPFSCFRRLDSFLTVPRASTPLYMFCTPGLIFGSTEGVGSCFALTDSFSVVRRSSGPVFLFYAPGLVFGGSEGVESSFHVLRALGAGYCLHVLRARTHFRPYRGRPVLFSCIALPNMFSAAPRALGPVFIFCASGHVFGGTEGVGSRFHVLRALTRFRRKRGCRVPFSCFLRPDSFSTVPRASGPIFMFCAPGLIFGGNKGVGSRFHVLRSRAHFLRYQELWIPFSSFALSDSFLAVPRASGPVFMFCAPGLIFGSTDGVGFRFHVLRS
jgi:hypothetical protein